MNNLYAMTHMTGRRNKEGRTSVIGTVEVQTRGFWIGASFALLGFISSALFIPLLGPAPVFILPPLFAAVGLFLFNTRQRYGTGGYQWRAMKDSFQARSRGRQQMMFHQEHLSTLPTRLRQMEGSSIPLIPIDADGDLKTEDERTIFGGL